jgi:hypothetical protein
MPTNKKKSRKQTRQVRSEQVRSEQVRSERREEEFEANMVEFDNQRARFAENGKVGVWRFENSEDDNLVMKVVALHELYENSDFNQWYIEHLRDIRQRQRNKELYCTKSATSSAFSWNFQACSNPECMEHCCHFNQKKMYCLRIALSSEPTPNSFVAPKFADQVPEYLWFKNKKNMKRAYKYICTPQ